MRMRVLLITGLIVIACNVSMANAAEPTEATTIATTRPQELPDPFRFADGRRVASIDDWNSRRKELLDVILTHQYGHLPPPPKEVSAAMLISHRYRPLMATHQQFKVTCDLGAGKEKIAFVIDLLYPP